MVEGNREWLVRLLAGLVALLGTGELVPRRLKREVLARLVPMEAALRRLIVVAARDVDVPLPPRGLPRPRAGDCVGGKRSRRGAGTGADGERSRIGCGTEVASRPPFRLTDRMRVPVPLGYRPARRGAPRITFFDGLDEPRPPVPPLPDDDDAVDTAALRRRLAAMEGALADLPAQAKRLLRWYARRNRAWAAGRFFRLYPLRTGRPPGHRARGKRDVDDVLATCHELAVAVRNMLAAERAAAG